jgi:hypothetical protein
MMKGYRGFLAGILLAFLIVPDLLLAQDKDSTGRSQIWQRHTIDDSSLGADGTKFADVNKDGQMDLISGWEEGGVSRIYLHPKNPKDKWSYIELPSPDVEDAFVADLNNDGYMDLITLSEGAHQRVTVHWAPNNAEDYLRAENWISKDVPVTIGKTKWMFGRALDVDGENGLDLIIGSKNPTGTLGWLKIPEDPMQMVDWEFNKISDAGWIMSIEILDMNNDGEQDLVITDRKGELRGLRWLENPGKGALSREWKNHLIGASEGEPMFMDYFEIGKGSADIDFIVPDLATGWEYFIKKKGEWSSEIIPFPGMAGRRGKSVIAEDINQDCQFDLIASFEGALDRSGLIALMNFQSKNPYVMDISGKEGVKYDFILIKDIDGDGDLDVITSEETAADGSKKGLGVVWYENPIK